MKRNVDPDYEFEKERFAEAFTKALGGETKAAFAKKADVSPGFISRYINLKYDCAPTLTMIKKIANATSRVTYDELLESAGYDSSKYISAEDEVEMFSEDGDVSPMSYFSLIFASVARADFNWKFVAMSGEGSEPFSLEIKDAPFDKWYFIPVTKTDITSDEIMSALSSIDGLAENPNSKITFMSSYAKCCEKIKKINFGFILPFMSVMLVDPIKGVVLDEAYLNTATKISEKDKEKYSITMMYEEKGKQFYTI